MSNQPTHKWAEPPCKYSSNVYCSRLGRRCDKCGWNPDVAERRKEVLRKEHGYV